METTLVKSPCFGSGMFFPDPDPQHRLRSLSTWDRVRILFLLRGGDPGSWSKETRFWSQSDKGVKGVFRIPNYGYFTSGSGSSYILWLLKKCVEICVEIVKVRIESRRPFDYVSSESWRSDTEKKANGIWHQKSCYILCKYARRSFYIKTRGYCIWNPRYTV